MQGKEHICEVPVATAPEQGVRLCEWSECGEEGLYRAPRSREALRSYHWFCLVHVRRYNSAWNYYAGMNDAEVEADIRMDTVWGRPSWPLGGGRADFGRLDDVFGIFEGPGHDPSRRPTVPGRVPGPEARALEVLDLRPPLTVVAVKARYKELVKRHHPDANGGDKSCEEKFKVISQAYETLMDGLAP